MTYCRENQNDLPDETVQKFCLAPLYVKILKIIWC